MRTLLEHKEALGKEAGGCGGHHTRREDSVKGGEPKLQLPPHLHLHLHQGPISRAQCFSAGPGAAAGAEKAHSGAWVPFHRPVPCCNTEEGDLV